MLRNRFKNKLVAVGTAKVLVAVGTAMVLVAVGTAMVLVVMVGLNSAAAAAPPAKPASGADTYRQLGLFAEAFDQVRSQYVDKVTDQVLIESAINGMLSSLDPHSEYMNEKVYKDHKTQIKGEFGGLGIEVTMENGLVKVVTPIDDTPAAKAGLRSGDLIVKLDATPVLGLTLNEAIARLRGKPDTEIKIIVKREGVSNFEVTLRRAIIKTEAVKSQIVDNDLLYLRISTFLNENVGADLVKHVNRAKEQTKGSLRGIVIDLRNNGGGLLTQAVAVSDSFLDKGEIVSIRGRKPDEIQVFYAANGDISNGLPIVVLINGGSASASEIVAGALQDRRRAVLIGTKSFGKGSVQSEFPLESMGALKFTTARYYTPSGRSIQAVGIEPDILIPQAKIEVIEEPLNFKESEMRGALKNPNAAVEAPANQPAERLATTPAKAAANLPPPLINKADTQLQRAIEVLHGITYFSQKVK
ncbi:MAG: S41 family peptidase [Alphaproteobacteria bacterium]|nr:S41 family peptidase [Alphaproteobacteria bacterium]